MQRGIFIGQINLKLFIDFLISLEPKERRDSMINIVAQSGRPVYGLMKYFIDTEKIFPAELHKIIQQDF